MISNCNLIGYISNDRLASGGFVVQSVDRTKVSPFPSLL